MRRTHIEQIAAEVFGEPMTIEAKRRVARRTARRGEDKPSPLRDDPVVSAFQKHLGGEIVESRSEGEPMKSNN